MGAICHTINPRLHPDDIAYIINHAGDSVLFVDVSFAGADPADRAAHRATACAPW